MSRVTVTVAAGYLTLKNGAVIEQRIEGLYLAGETVTVSVQTDAEIISGTSVFPTAAVPVNITLAGLGAATLGYNAEYMFVRFTADADRNLVRVKGELGTVSTLHLDPPMDHAVELPKCQRYFLRYDRAMPALGVGYMDTATNARLSVHLPVGMRVRPPIAYTALDNFRAICNGVVSTLSALSVYTASGSELWLNTTTTTALSVQQPAVLRVTADNDITFSADL